MQLKWAPSALHDVQRLHRFLLDKSPDAASRAVAAIRNGVRVLGEQPLIGRPVDDMPVEFRDWIIDFGDSGYVARYRVDAAEVVILAIRHQREVGF